jgi:uncharacterized phiE125 gp8 family phage protein
MFNELVDRLPYNSQPKVMPVSLAELKEHIQLVHSSDDAILAEYLEAALAETENRGQVALIEQKRVTVLDGWPDGPVNLHFRPNASVTLVQYVDTAGATQTLVSTSYRVSSTGLPRIEFISSLPACIDGVGTVKIFYTCGYGAAGSAVPNSWKHIVRIIAAHLYEARIGVLGKDDFAWERMIERKVIAAGGLRSYA